VSGRKRASRAKAKTKTARPRFRREASAGGVVFRLVGGEPKFLLIRDTYGNWGFPKGHIEKGEAPQAAAVREVAEETGIESVTLVEPIEPIEWVFRWDGTLIRKRCHFFLMSTDVERTEPQTEEGITACEWATASDAMQRIKYANARDVLRRATDLVSSRAT
jgi:8-oxo-dGTP pyrophosphatase MutT (NUDIX family)